jgi:hypothetical protein
MRIEFNRRFLDLIRKHWACKPSMLVNGGATSR